MQYDALDRLIQASNQRFWGTQNYTYDPLDNLRRSQTSSLDLTNVYNATTQRLDSLNTTGGGVLISYNYDDRGRVTSRTPQTFTVDLADRVVNIGPSVATYRYDGHGRRTSVTKGTTTQVQVYSQAGQLLYQSAPVSGSTGGIFKNGFQGNENYAPATGGNRRYIYLGRHLIAEEGIDGRRYQHTDGLGSPTQTSTSNGSFVPADRRLYQPYGYGVPTDSKPGFTGHVADEETGLSYMQARYYDPYAGRFLAADSVEASVGSFNRYWYAGNNPYRSVDPDGRQAIDRFNDAFAKDPKAFEPFAPYVTAVVPGFAAAECIAGGCGALAWIAAAADAVPGAGKVAGKLFGKAFKSAADVAQVKKKVPNPFGKKGGTPHQSKVNEIEEDMRSRGVSPEAEYMVRTPGGNKEKRFVDIVGRDAEGDVVEMHQVGRQTKGGSPVSREVKALDDIEGATGVRPDFHPYND